MMMRLEMYRGCFPRAKEDMVEVSLNFQLWILLLLFSLGTVHPAPKPRPAVSQLELSSFTLTLHCGIPTKLAILIDSLVPKVLLSFFCWILAVAVTAPAPLVTHAVLAAWRTRGPDVLRAEIQRAAAAVLSRTLFASHLHWAHGLTTTQSSWDQRKYEPWCSLLEFHLLCSFLLWNSNIRNLPKKWNNTMGLSYFLLILFISLPPQICHRDIQCSTRASEDLFPGRPCLWEGLSYLLFVWCYIFNWVIYLLGLCIHSSARKRVKEMTSLGKKAKYPNVNMISLLLFRLREGMEIHKG